MVVLKLKKHIIHAFNTINDIMKSQLILTPFGRKEWMYWIFLANFESPCDSGIGMPIPTHRNRNLPR